MIKLDISSLVFFYTLSTAILIIMIWIIGSYKNKERTSPKYAEYLWKCAVCANAYVDSRHIGMSACPLCGSYNKREDSMVG